MICRLKLNRRRSTHFAKTPPQVTHRQAVIYYDEFTDRQANLFAQCLTVSVKLPTDGPPLKQRMTVFTQKDALIERIWFSSSSIKECKDLPERTWEVHTLQDVQPEPTVDRHDTNWKAIARLQEIEDRLLPQLFDQQRQ